MPEIKVKNELIQTRETGAVLTREAAKTLDSGVKSAGRPNERPQKATAEAGRDATEQVEDAAKAKAVQTAQIAGRVLAMAKARRKAADNPPLEIPDLYPPATDLPPNPPPELPPAPESTFPDQPTAPPITDGAVLSGEPPVESPRLWRTPEHGEVSVVPQVRTPAPTVDIKGVEQAKRALQIEQAAGGKETLFQAPKVGPEDFEVQKPTPHGPPPPTHQLHIMERPSMVHYDTSPMPLPQSTQKDLGLHSRSSVKQERPEIIKAKKKLQIKRFQARRERHKQELRERDRTSTAIREGLFQAPSSVSEAPLSLQTTGGRPGPTDAAPPAAGIGRTTPGKEKARPIRTLLGRTRRERIGITGRSTQAVRQAKALAVRKAKRAAARQATKDAVAAGKTGAKLLKKLSIAVAAGVKALASALGPVLGVGAAVLAVLILVAAAAAVLGSPYGVLFANENDAPGTVPISTAVGQLNTEFSNYLTALQAQGYDDVVIHGSMADWAEVLAVFAVKTAGRTTQAVDVITMDPSRVELLSAVFWDMNPVRTWVEAIYHPPSGEDDSGWTEYILHIYIMGKTAEEMAGIYGFTRDQRQMLNELLTDYRALLTGLANDLTIPGGDASDVVAALPEELDPARRAAVEKALSLVGKVGYFGGGKSYKMGWDDRWGTLQQVTASGSSTSGTWIPFGLDCSGFLELQRWEHLNLWLEITKASQIRGRFPLIVPSLAAQFPGCEL